MTVLVDTGVLLRAFDTTSVDYRDVRRYEPDGITIASPHSLLSH